MMKPRPCGGVHDKENVPMLKPEPATLDQTVGSLPAVSWTCLCGWSRTERLPEEKIPKEKV